MNKFKEKVIIITGASKGLGRALATGFVNQGAMVAGCARHTDLLSTLEGELQSADGEFLSMAVDINQAHQVESFISITEEKLGPPDVLINNASLLGPRLPISDYPEEEWRRVLDVNLTGVFLPTRRVIRGMVERNSGSIINVSSGVGVVGKPGWGAYLVSKFGIEGFSYMLAEELRESGVRVNIVNPGPIATAMRRAAYPEEDQSKLKKPEDILDVFYYLASDESKGLTGQRFDAQEFKLPA